jgi:elongator complex protein 2
MTKEVKVEMKDNAEEEENFDFSHFNPDEMLTNRATDTFSSKYDYSLPPDEDFLTNNTLWPENTKLYGHGYELISVASSHDGKIIASGCKAQSEKNSKLFLWSSENKNLICKLDGHVLTITQIEFSHDDQFILTVSRDRSICLYQKTDDPKSPYRLVQKEKESHERIIWGCSWSHDDTLFVTGSRDKSIKIWQRTSHDENKLFKEIINKELQESVTSVNLIPHKFNDNYVLIIGLENGNIEFYSVNPEEAKLSQIAMIHPFLVHGFTVTRIKSVIDIDNGLVRIATCSEDHSLRIFEISLAALEKKL